MVRIFWAMSPAPDGGHLADGVDTLRPGEAWKDLCGRLAAARGLTVERVFRPGFGGVQALLRDPADGRRVDLACG